MTPKPASIAAALALLALGAASSVARAGEPPAVDARPPDHRAIGGGPVVTTPPAPDPVFSHESAARRDEVILHFARRIADGCRYAGTLRGRIEPRSETHTYRADLVLDAQARCPDGTTARPAAEPIEGASMTRAELEHALAASGRLELRHAGRECEVTPTFVWRNNRIAFAGPFRESCRAARGGGPTRRGPVNRWDQPQR